jgi:hypothetical protein
MQMNQFCGASPARGINAPSARLRWIIRFSGNRATYWLGEAGQVQEAITEFRRLLEDRARVLGPDHPDTLATRNNLTFWLEQSSRS